ncbi:hypothetical protein OQ292_35170 (plasmid) [Chondrinema litorale]|nr:hypothetical protein [Chondrinema litorale]UZR98568.1 hypothetical protein OQ292_32590 [Chondrinema litorale]UZR99113.1 hypothetical protein OQ292_35170 [Chondrinema litorale]
MIELPLHITGRRTFLATAHQPDSNEPVAKRKFGSFHDGATAEACPKTA